MTCLCITTKWCTTDLLTPSAPGRFLTVKIHEIAKTVKMHKLVEFWKKRFAKTVKIHKFLNPKHSFPLILTVLMQHDLSVFFKGMLLWQNEIELKNTQWIVWMIYSYAKLFGTVFLNAKDFKDFFTKPMLADFKT